MHEHLADALAAAVQHLGGAKAAGVQIWPDLPADAAGRRLRDVLNPDRAEKLSLDQLVLLIRLGAAQGCHAPMQWLAQAVGYESVRPMNQDAERAALRRQMQELMQRLEDIEGKR